MKASWLALCLSLNGLAFDAARELLDAARKGDLAGINAALENHASIESKTRYGQTPLFLAAMNGHIEALQLLLENGAKVDVSDSFYKSSAIGFAASRKQIAAVKLMLPRSTDVDRNLDSVTSLRNPELVVAVLAAGKPSQASLDRNLELASSHAEIAELLRKAGAKPPPPGVDVEAKILESYTGAYRAEGLRFDIKASTKEGKLYLQATGQPEFAPKAKSATVCEFPAARLAVEFNGPGTFVLRQGGQTFNFKKVVVTR